MSRTPDPAGHDRSEVTRFKAPVGSCAEHDVVGKTMEVTVRFEGETPMLVAWQSVALFAPGV